MGAGERCDRLHTGRCYGRWPRASFAAALWRGGGCAGLFCYETTSLSRHRAGISDGGPKRTRRVVHRILVFREPLGMHQCHGYLPTVDGRQVTAVMVRGGEGPAMTIYPAKRGAKGGQSEKG